MPRITMANISVIPGVTAITRRHARRVGGLAPTSRSKQRRLSVSEPAEDVQTLRDALESLDEASHGWLEDNRYKRAHAAAEPALDRLVAEIQRLQDAEQRGRIEIMADDLRFGSLEAVLFGSEDGRSLDAMLDEASRLRATEARLQAAEHALQKIADLRLDENLPTDTAISHARLSMRAIAEAALRAAAAPAGLWINRHPLHHCMTCGTEGAPGPGCGNCRQTGFDQTPCLHPDCQGAAPTGQENIADAGQSVTFKNPAVGDGARRAITEYGPALEALAEASGGETTE
jgi:hypothetical protein